MNLPALGSSKDDLDTPALCVDLDIFEANIESIAAMCRCHRVAWRPHAKCHKSPVIARKLVQAGAIGVTCAKLGEAEILAAGGVKDLLIANMIVGPKKLERLVALRRLADPLVCADHLEQVEAFNRVMTEAGLTVRVLVEINLGLNRVGIEPGEAAIGLARKINALPGVQLAGIMGYEGHLLTLSDPSEKETKIREALALLADTKHQLQELDLPCPIVSCGGTGSFTYAIKLPEITELQAGGCIFMDAFYRQKCQISDLEHALSVLTTVVSLPTPERAIIDAGHKALNMSVHQPYFESRPDLTVAWLSAEHGAVDVSPDGAPLKIGQQLELIPGYGDLTNMLHPYFHGFRNDRLEQLIPIMR